MEDQPTSTGVIGKGWELYGGRERDRRMRGMKGGEQSIRGWKSEGFN